MTTVGQHESENLRQSMKGQRAYHSGASAELTVERRYIDQGFTVAARRWRKGGGELDIVVRGDDILIFVEVKKARDFSTAADRLSPRQIERLLQGASAFLANEPAGELTDCRFDVALVNQIGDVKILENALVGF